MIASQVPTSPISSPKERVKKDGSHCTTPSQSTVYRPVANDRWRKVGLAMRVFNENQKGGISVFCGRPFAALDAGSSPA